MTDIDLTSLIYLIVLVTLIGGWFLAEYGRSFGRVIRMALAWFLIFFAFIAAYGLWDDVRDDLIPQQTVLEDGARIEVPRRTSGHFHLTVELDGVPVDFLVDTGATDIVLNEADARRVGLNPDGMAFIGRARTANGEVETAYGTVGEIKLGPIVHRNVSVAVNRGDMPGSLLGMSYLGRFDRIEISGDKLTLVP